MSADRVFHYTTGASICEIVKSGVVGLSFSERLQALDWPGEPVANPRPAVWASVNQVWEPAATQLIGSRGIYSRNERAGNMLQVADQYEGLFRVELQPAAVPLTWLEYLRLEGGLVGAYGYTPGMIKRACARRGTNVEEWRAGMAPVPESEWLGIDVWRGRRFENRFGFLPVCGGPNEPPAWERIDLPLDVCRLELRKRRLRL